MSCCPTFELNALEATGNLASGQTDLVNNAVLKAFIARQPHPSVPLCCPTVPFISPYAGGNSSGGLSVGLLRQQQFCDASQNLAIATMAGGAIVMAAVVSDIAVRRRGAADQAGSL